MLTTLFILSAAWNGKAWCCRDGSIVHIDYAAQFSGSAAKAGGDRAAGGSFRKQGRGSLKKGRAGPDAAPASGRYGAAQGTPESGHWITEYQRRKRVKVGLVML